MERSKCTLEFKLEAARLIKDRGVSCAQAAENLGVHAAAQLGEGAVGRSAACIPRPRPEEA